MSDTTTDQSGPLESDLRTLAKWLKAREPAMAFKVVDLADYAGGLEDALRECVAAMENAVETGILYSCGTTILDLRAAAAKARAAMGE